MPGEDVGRRVNAGAVATVSFSCVQSRNCLSWNANSKGVPGSRGGRDRFGSPLGRDVSGDETVGVPGEDNGRGSVVVGLATDTAYEWKLDGNRGDAFGLSITTG